MKKRKILIPIVSALILLIAGGIYLNIFANEDLRNMGFPSLRAVPNGFSSVTAKTMDLGAWCEITYENEVGDFMSLDCYELGTLDNVYLENFLMDYEKTAENVSIKGKEAAVYKSKDDQLHILTWEDDKNQAKCLLGGNIPIDDMVKAAKSVKYDKKKAVIEPENDTITPTPKADGTIETNYLKQYEDLLSRIMKPVFEGYQEENSGATLSFELDSFYKSFDFAIEDHLLVEVFDYEYYMKSKDAIIMTDGMYRDKDRNIRLFYGSFGQIAAVSRDGQFLKAVPITRMDIKLEPESTDSKESSDWIKEKVLTSIKVPAYHTS